MGVNLIGCPKTCGRNLQIGCTGDCVYVVCKTCPFHMFSLMSTQHLPLLAEWAKHRREHMQICGFSAALWFTKWDCNQRIALNHSHLLHVVFEHNSPFMVEEPYLWWGEKQASNCWGCFKRMFQTYYLILFVITAESSNDFDITDLKT